MMVMATLIYIFYDLSLCRGILKRADQDLSEIESSLVEIPFSIDTVQNHLD